MHDTQLAPADRGETLTFATSASGGQFVGLSIKQALLNIVTLTLYRFWARTEVRKRLWSATSLNGESFEYTGRGMELFKGFLLALVVFTIPYLLVVFGGQLLPPAIGIPLILAFMLFAFWAIGAATWLAFRYLASRTVWRGIRFQLKGSPSAYGWLVFGQSILTTITLGWYAPKAFLNQAEALWGSLHFGDLPFSFNGEDARQEKLYGRFAIAWFGAFFGYFILIAISLFMTEVLGVDFDQAEELPTMVAIYAAFAVGFAVFFLIVLLAFAAYNVACWRAIARGLKLDGAEFMMDLRTPGYIWLEFSNALIITFTLGFLIPVAQARTFAYIMGRLKSEGMVDFSLADQAERGPRQAEGLADAFDIGII